jgi:hypothetical protein
MGRTNKECNAWCQAKWNSPGAECVEGCKAFTEVEKELEENGSTRVRYGKYGKSKIEKENFEHK